MIKTRILFSFFVFLFVCVSNVSSFSFGKKDSVTIITIIDSCKMNKIAAAKSSALAIDSSRFVKRKVKDLSDRPLSYGNFKVNKSIFGIYTDYILDYVKNYHENHGDRLARIKSNNRGYFSLIDNVMKRYGCPKEMKSLAVIESAMNCNAVSPVGAVGPWQFMAGTAKDLGLRVDENIDERRDFYKSTNAAARYLKQLYGMFHDWLLVIASYNCGPAPVLRAVNSGMGRSFWDIKPKLPKETQNHVMAFIATSTFFDKVCNVLGLGEIPKGAKAPKVDFSSLSAPKNVASGDLFVADNEDAEKPKYTQEELDKMAILKVKGTYTISAIARVLDEDVVRLKRWNPGFDEEIKKTLVPIRLKIPIAKLEQFIIAKDRILIESRKGN